MPPRTLLVGCEPLNIPDSEANAMHMGLSEPVQLAAEKAVPFIDQLIADLLAHRETQKGAIHV